MAGEDFGGWPARANPPGEDGREHSADLALEPDAIADLRRRLIEAAASGSPLALGRRVRGIGPHVFKVERSDRR